MADLIIWVVFMAGFYLIGTTIIEKGHYNSIREREKKFLNLPAITAKNLVDTTRPIEKVDFVCGNVVISIDHFKRFLASLRNIFGGEVSSLETVLDRARREAILRMKESMPEADIILNLRVETSTIGRSQGKNNIGASEVLAWGTAITYKK